MAQISRGLLCKQIRRRGVSSERHCIKTLFKTEQVWKANVADSVVLNVNATAMFRKMKTNFLPRKLYDLIQNEEIKVCICCSSTRSEESLNYTFSEQQLFRLSTYTVPISEHSLFSFKNLFLQITSIVMPLNGIV